MLCLAKASSKPILHFMFKERRKQIKGSVKKKNNNNTYDLLLIATFYTAISRKVVGKKCARHNPEWQYGI